MLFGSIVLGLWFVVLLSCLIGCYYSFYLLFMRFYWCFRVAWLCSIEFFYSLIIILIFVLIY